MNMEEARKSSNQSFSCHRCSKFYILKTSLSRHMRTIHNEDLEKSADRPYPCSHCNRYFKNRTNLAIHIKHINKKLHHCEYCTNCLLYTSPSPRDS